MVALLGETELRSCRLGRTGQDTASVDNVDTMLGHSSPRTI